MKESQDITRTTAAAWFCDEATAQSSELRQSDEVLAAFAHVHAVAPLPSLREQILGKIGKLDLQKRNHRKLDPANLPRLDENSNLFDWEEFAAAFEPPAEYEDIHLHTIESNEQRELFVAWVKEKVSEEVHFDLLESFLLLEGTCECHVTDPAGNCRIVRMVQGDFIAMKIGEQHDIVITSRQPAKAILQWWKLAA